jgi:hypothetical protein
LCINTYFFLITLSAPDDYSYVIAMVSVWFLQAMILLRRVFRVVSMTRFQPETGGASLLIINTHSFRLATFADQIHLEHPWWKQARKLGDIHYIIPLHGISWYKRVPGCLVCKFCNQAQCLLGGVSTAGCVKDCGVKCLEPSSGLTKQGVVSS